MIETNISTNDNLVQVFCGVRGYEKDGAAILHKLVVELEKAGIETLATIHDAIFFMADENDWEKITLAKELMRKTANDYLGCTDHGIKVGDPEIIKHGEIWTPEHAYDDAAKKVLEAGGYAC